MKGEDSKRGKSSEMRKSVEQCIPRGLINCLPQTVVASDGGSGLLSLGSSLYLAAQSPNLWAVSASSKLSSEPTLVAESNCS